MILRLTNSMRNQNSLDELDLLLNRVITTLEVHHKTQEPIETIEQSMFVRRDLSPEHQMIETCLKEYINLDLEVKIHSCIGSARSNYFSTIRNQPIKSLTTILDFSKEEDFASALESYFLGSGSYGFVLANLQNFPPSVMKISFGVRKMYNPLSPFEMPWEYCIGATSETDYLLKPIERSFQPILVPKEVFNNKIKVGNDNLHFGEPVVAISKNIVPGLPMFEMPFCQEINWSSIKKPDALFMTLLRHLKKVHESGIALIDISPRNLLSCNGEIKFIDFGFAQLFSKVKDIVQVNDFTFGNQHFRSPWAHIITKMRPVHLQRMGWNYKESLILELIANDFWSLATIFGVEFCGFSSKDALNFGNIQKDINYFIRESQRESEYFSFDANDISQFVNSYLAIFFAKFESILDISKSCPVSLQKMLQSVLQVNPVVRMTNVESLLK